MRGMAEALCIPGLGDRQDMPEVLASIVGLLLQCCGLFLSTPGI
jgi:hypothetical protein